MSKAKADKSFAEKYGLVGQGAPIRHSERIQKMIEAATVEGKAFRLRCEAAAKLDNTRYRLCK